MHIFYSLLKTALANVDGKNSVDDLEYRIAIWKSPFVEQIKIHTIC